MNETVENRVFTVKTGLFFFIIIIIIINISRACILHIVQTGSGAQPATYPMGTWGSFLGDK
jgi:hypothetical protein